MKNIEKYVQQLMESYSKEYKNTDFWNKLYELIEDLKQNGFESKEVYGNKMKGQSRKNMNVVYSKEDCPYVFIIIFTSSEKKAFPLVIEKEVYENKVAGRHISIMRHHHRPLVAVDGKIRKLHKFVMNMEDNDSLEIDHITHSSNICVSKFMRICSKRENWYNRPVYMTISDDNEFTGKFEVNDEADKRFLEELNYKGFYVEPIEESGLYRITSPDTYMTEATMLKDVQKIEKRLMKDYRYNPLLDCTHPVSQILMFRYLFGLITKQDLEEGQKYFMQQTKDEFFLQYYELNK